MSNQTQTARAGDAGSEPKKTTTESRAGETSGPSTIAPLSDKIGLGDSIRQIDTIAGTEVRLAVRNRWAFALVGLFAFFGMMLATFSGSPAGPSGLKRVLASLASLSVYIVPLAALAFGYDAIVGREEEGWLAVVVALPTSRSTVVAGTFFGRAVVLSISVLAGFGIVAGLLVREYGFVQLYGLAAFLLGAVMLGAAFLALAVLVSTVAPGKTHALGVSLLLWVWFVLVHDLIALGLVAALSLSETALTALVLANPASVFRVLVLGALEASGGGFAAAMAATDLSMGLLALVMICWALLPVGLASIAIRRRRL